MGLSVIGKSDEDWSSRPFSLDDIQDVEQAPGQEGLTMIKEGGRTPKTVTRHLSPEMPEKMFYLENEIGIWCDMLFS